MSREQCWHHREYLVLKMTSYSLLLYNHAEPSSDLMAAVRLLTNEGIVLLYPNVNPSKSRTRLTMIILFPLLNCPDVCIQVLHNGKCAVNTHFISYIDWFTEVLK